MKMEEKRGKRSPVALAGLGVFAHHLFLWGVLRGLAWSVIKVMADHDILDNMIMLMKMRINEGHLDSLQL